MKKSVHLLQTLRYFLRITIGCLIYAVGVNWLFQPNEIVVGGATGISQIINHFFSGIPVGAIIIAINIPLFILGIRMQGIKLLVSSLYSMLLGSVFIDLVALLFTFEPMENRLVACLFGGVLLGLSMGMQLMAGATNGGSDLAARLLKYKFPHVSIGKLCLIIDLCVIIIYAIAFRDLETTLYGMIAMYTSSVAMDYIVYGGTQAKMAFIISNAHEQIRQELLALNVGITILDGRGGWSEQRTDVILCAFRKVRIAQIKETVMQIDPDAFLIVNDAHEVLGEGFGVYQKGSL